MQKIILSLTLLIGLNIAALAQTPDAGSDLFHTRIEQRYSNVNFKEFKKLDESEIPAQIQELRERQHNDLLQFARAYDLFAIGWSYAMHDNVYEVSLANGEVVIYTFSDVISKNGVPTGRRFYQASRRVDGVFYIERIADY